MQCLQRFYYVQEMTFYVQAMPFYRNILLTVKSYFLCTEEQLDPGIPLLYHYFLLDNSKIRPSYSKFGLMYSKFRRII